MHHTEDFLFLFFLPVMTDSIQMIQTPLVMYLLTATQEQNLSVNPPHHRVCPAVGSRTVKSMQVEFRTPKNDGPIKLVDPLKESL